MIKLDTCLADYRYALQTSNTTASLCNSKLLFSTQAIKNTKHFQYDLLFKPVLPGNPSI